MRKTLLLAASAAVAVAASGIPAAADFETDIRNVETRLADHRTGARIEVSVTEPVPADSWTIPGSKWWSLSFFGSAHKAITKAALKFVDKTAFPDIAAAKDLLIEGSKDEGGHISSEKNGGPVEELWFGNTSFSQGGVLRNYLQFRFNEAYSRLGTICHLTQDQSTPTHAANIKHSINDSFEGLYDNTVKLPATRDRLDLKPYEYYQALQDETRRKLPGWTDPETGAPYWVEAPDAPPLGQDATLGPWGRYGGRKNRDVYAVPPRQENSPDGGSGNNTWVSAHPEIRLQQLAAAGVYTVRVLEAASKRLPPLVQNLSVSMAAARSVEGTAAGYRIQFNIFENRSPNVTYSVAVYRDGAAMGTAAAGSVSLFAPSDGALMYSGILTSSWSGKADAEVLPAGNYVLDVRVTDADGNTTPEEVNTDSDPSNDTRVAVTIY